MKGKTHNTEEIIRILRQADGGETAQAICREHNIFEQTFYRWKKKYGDMELADAKRLKELEKDNTELNKDVGGSHVGKPRALKRLIQKNGKPRAKENGRRPCRGSATVLGAQGLSSSGPGVIWSLARSTYRYTPKPVPDRQQQLHQRIVALSWAYPRYGYRRIRRALAKEGWTVSRKQVQRIRRCEGLKVRPKPKKVPRCGVSTGLPTQAEHRQHVWTWDFIFDRTDTGGTIKMMTLLDEYTRQCLTIRV